MGRTKTVMVCLLVLASAVAPSIAAQTSTDSTLLISEIRTLRQAVELLATSGLRIQIVFGRLQLQEQRTNTAMGRLDAARERLTDALDRISGLNDELKRYEDAAASTRDSQQLEALTSMTRETKKYITRMETERARLAVEESDAAGRLAYEQARWSELNSILDELERGLVITAVPRRSRP